MSAASSSSQRSPRERMAVDLSLSDSPISAADMIAARRRKRRSTNRMEDDASRYTHVTDIHTPAPSKRGRQSAFSELDATPTMRMPPRRSATTSGRMPVASTPFPRRLPIASPAPNATQTPTSRMGAAVSGMFQSVASKRGRKARQTDDESGRRTEVGDDSSVIGIDSSSADSRRTRPAWMARWGAGQEESPMDILRKLAAAPGFTATPSPAYPTADNTLKSQRNKRSSAIANTSAVSDLGRARNRRATQEQAAARLFESPIDDSSLNVSNSAYAGVPSGRAARPSVSQMASFAFNEPSAMQEATRSVSLDREPLAENEIDNIFDLPSSESVQSGSDAEAEEAVFSSPSSNSHHTAKSFPDEVDAIPHPDFNDESLTEGMASPNNGSHAPQHTRQQSSAPSNRYYENSDDSDEYSSEDEENLAELLKRVQQIRRPIRKVKASRASKLTGKPTETLPTKAVGEIFNVMITPSSGLNAGLVRGRGARRPKKAVVDSSALEAVEDVSHDFFVDMAKALSSSDRVKAQRSVDEKDIVALLRANGFIDQRNSLVSLARRYLPRELSDLLAPDADQDDTLIGNVDEGDETFIDGLVARYDPRSPPAATSSKRRNRKRISLGYALHSVEHLADLTDIPLATSKASSHDLSDIWSEPPMSHGRQAKQQRRQIDRHSLSSDVDSSEVYSSE